MSKSLKVALLSGLIFPGAGHLYLKSYGRGITLIGVSAICVFILMSKVFDQANAVLQKMQAEGSVFDPARIVELAAQTPPAADTPALGVATVGLIACWFIGVIDAYRLGKR